MYLSALFGLIQDSIISLTSGICTFSKLCGLTPLIEKTQKDIIKLNQSNVL